MTPTLEPQAYVGSLFTAYSLMPTADANKANFLAFIFSRRIYTCSLSDHRLTMGFQSRLWPLYYQDVVGCVVHLGTFVPNIVDFSAYFFRGRQNDSKSGDDADSSVHIFLSCDLRSYFFLSEQMRFSSFVFLCFFYILRLYFSFSFI